MKLIVQKTTPVKSVRFKAIREGERVITRGNRMRVTRFARDVEAMALSMNDSALRRRAQRVLALMERLRTA